MNFATYKTALLAWVDAQGGLDSAAEMEGEEGGWQGKTRARLRIMAPKGVGIDHVTSEQDDELPAGTDMVPTYKGDRAFTCQITVTSRNQDGNGIASWHLDKLYTSLPKPSVKALFKAAGIAYSSAEEIRDLDHWSDDRNESQAQLDVRFNAVVNETDTAEADSYVETFEVTGTLTTPAGDDIVYGPEELP